MQNDCLYCGKQYETQRENSYYCSNSCRTGSYKSRKKEEKMKAERELAEKARKEKDALLKLEEEKQRQLRAESRLKAKNEKKAKQAINEEFTLCTIPIQQENTIESAAVEEVAAFPKPEEAIASITTPKNFQARKSHLKPNRSNDSYFKILNFLLEIVKSYNNPKI